MNLASRLPNLPPGLQTGGIALTGSFLAQDNYVDTTAVPMVGIDDNAIALGTNFFDDITFRGNTMISNGESSEIENAVGNSITVEDNTIESRMTQTPTSFPSFLATEVVGFPGVRAGHGDGLNAKGVDTVSVVIRNNNIVTSGVPTGVCIEAWQSPTTIHTQPRTTLIEGNNCEVHGQFAGLMVGWSGEMPFFVAGTLDDAVVRDNVVTGEAMFGLALADYNVQPAPANNLINTGHDNVFEGNDLTGLDVSTASVYFGPSTFNNSFVGAFSGPVLDQGTGNTIVNTAP